MSDLAMADMPSSETWVKFFQDAGIPEELSAQYAVLFSDHRIQKDMLSELDRDILSDIGIRAVGDKMAILKHARYVSEQSKRDASSKQLVDGLKLSARKKKLPVQTKAQTEPKTKKIDRAPFVSSESMIVLTSSAFTEVDPEKRSVFQRLGEGKRNPNSTTSASKCNMEIASGQKVEQSSVLQRLGCQTSNADIVTPHTKKKIVTLKKKAIPTGREPAVDQQLKQALIKKPSVLDRLGRAVVDEPNLDQSDELLPKLKVNSGTTMRKTNLIKIPQKRRSDINEESQTLPAKKPISSNAVSSTSAGLFRGRTKCSSVFDRLGAKS